MGELLDLILDFEKKLLALIRDLVVRPQKVAQSIVDKDKQYLGSFKFYSLITSLWIIVVHSSTGLEVFDISTDYYVVPIRFKELLESEQDFAFLIAPFIGMVEFFLPFGIINYFLFRKRQLSFLNHITLNVHLAAIILVYELPVLVILALIGQFTTWLNDIDQIITIPLLLVVPILYYGYVHVRVFGTQKILSFIKPIITLFLIGYLSMTYLLDSPVHEMIHQKIFFYKYQQFDLEPTISADSVSYSSRFLSQAENVYLTIGPPDAMKRSNSFVFWEYNKQKQSFDNYFLSFDSKDTVQIPLDINNLFLSGFSQQQLDSSPRQFIVKQTFCDCNDTVYFWTYDELRKQITPKTTFWDYVSTSSRMFLHGDNLWFTGVDSKSHRPMLGLFSQKRDSVMSIIPIKNADNFKIDQIHTVSTATASSVNLLLSLIENKRLKEIRWISGNMSDSTFTQSSEVVIYKNEFTPTNDISRIPLHRSNYNQVTDSTAIVSFQVMTDSSFALNVASINTKRASTNWSSIYTIPADFSFNDAVLADEHSIYVIGRALSVFRMGFSITNYQLPYLLIIDSKTGLKKKLEFLPFDVELHLLSPNEMYRFTSSAYHDKKFIYLTVGGEVNMLHSYIIKK